MINKVILMGRLTADPELRQTQSGVASCRFSIAINRNYTPKDGGERQTDFINIVTWRQQAEFVSRYFSKGKMIIVEGSLRNNNYTDNNGVKHYTMDVQADNITFGESKSASNNSNGNQYGNNSYNNNNNNYSAPQQQNYSAPAQQQPAPQNFNNNDLSVGGVSEFEEILSDGDVPF